MDNENEMVGQQPTAEATTAEATQQEGNEATEQVAPNDGEAPLDEGIQSEPNATFTQEQVNDIVRERLRKASESSYKRYGVADDDELISVLGKGRQYDALKSQYDQLSLEKKALADKITLSENHIMADKADDVLTYFKGKGLELSDEALKQVVLTHPEWVERAPEPRYATAMPIGTEKTAGFPKESEEDIAKRMFGFDKFVD